MTLRPDWSLRVRILGALALVLAVNGLVVAALGWATVSLVSIAGGAVSTDLALPATVAGLLSGAIALVALQIRYGSRAVVSDLEAEPVEGDGPRGVATRLRRLATLADAPPPAVAVADRDEPVSLTVRIEGETTVVVTTGLLESLEDDELDATLAHELAHVANRDVTVVTAIAALVAVGDGLLARERILRRVLGVTANAAVLGGASLVLFALPLLALGIGYLAVSAVARLLVAVNAITLGLFANAREFAADRAASRLTGNPAALASALERLERSRPAQDARLGASATLGIVSHTLTFDEDDDGDHWIEPWLPDPALFGDPERTRRPRESGGEGAQPGGIAERLGSRVGEWVRRRLVGPVVGWLRGLVGPVVGWLRGLVGPVVGWLRGLVGPAVGRLRGLAGSPRTHPPTERRVERLSALE